MDPKTASQMPQRNKPPSKLPMSWLTSIPFSLKTASLNSKYASPKKFGKNTRIKNAPKALLSKLVFSPELRIKTQVLVSMPVLTTLTNASTSFSTNASPTTTNTDQKPLTPPT